MSASFTVDTSALERLAAQFQDPGVIREINGIPARTEIAAMVAQAIADNFQQEGPGWAPLKPSTIRQSVSQQVAKTKVKVGGKLKSLSELTDAELEKHEAKSRKNSMSSKEQPFRRILQRSGTLKKSVTVPGDSHNQMKMQGTQLIWGTDLVYAGVHNNGFPERNIPKREFLVIRKQWMDQIQEYILNEAMKIIQARITGGES